MFSIKTKTIVGLLATSAITIVPAFADHDDQNHDQNHHGGEHQQVRVQEERHDDKGHNEHNKGEHQQQVVQEQRHDNWDQDKQLYKKHWNSMAKTHQQEMDAEMRAQWLAYHHNQWKGNYSWNNYSDPGFLNYLHNSNPSLLTRVRSAIGF